MKHLLLTICLFVGGTQLRAQAQFSGKITYHITYESLPAELQGMEYMLPDSTFMFISGSKLRTEVPMPMGGEQVILFDADAKSGHILTNMMGAKIAVEITKEQVEAQELEEDYSESFIYLKETKNIAGYRCNKALKISSDAQGQSDTTEVYYTEDIPNVNTNFDGLNGMALMYKMEENGVKSTLKATRVMFKSIPESTFEIPEDYERMTLEELMELNK